MTLDTSFQNQRKRHYGSGTVTGVIIDPKEPNKRVRYECEGRGGVFPGGDKIELPTINWSAMGSVSVPEARRYAEQILTACYEAEIPPREFEPNDEVTSDKFPEDYKGFVSEVRETGVVVEYGIPGKNWEKTMQVMVLGFDKVMRVTKEPRK